MNTEFTAYISSLSSFRRVINFFLAGYFLTDAILEVSLR